MVFDSAFSGMLVLTLPLIFLAALYWVVRIAVRDGVREANPDRGIQQQADVDAS